MPGESAILVRYRGAVAVCRVTLPRGETFELPPSYNEVDEFVWQRLERLGIRPSPEADDATFLRRVSLDLIGTLPTSEEAAGFLSNRDPNKREQLVDALLKRPEYGTYWAMKWADILRVDREILKPQGTIAMTRWLRRQLNENRPYDEIVREILSIRGKHTQ